MTPLDIAHQAMQASDNDAPRRKFYERVADCELFLLLEAEPTGDQIKPMLFPVENIPFALVFDTEERLAEFAQSTAQFVAAPGRQIIQMLVGQNIALGLNVGVAPSSILLPPDVLDWTAEMLTSAPVTAELTPTEIAPPQSLPEKFLASLDQKLAALAGLATNAYLAEASYENGTKGTLLAIIDAVPGAEDAIATAMAEALSFSGLEAGALDVSFLSRSNPICVQLAKWGLRFDIPRLKEPSAPTMPGSDPSKPPILR